MMKENILKSSFAVWNQLSVEEQQLLIDSVETKVFQEHQIIHRGSLDCTGLIIIVEGALRAYITSSEGKEVTLYHLYPYDICLFSASCLLKDINFEVEIECEQTTTCYLIPTARYEAILSRSATLLQYNHSILAKKFSSVVWLLEQIVFNRLDQRLATYLIDQTYNLDNNTLHYTHEKIAKDLGTAREVISRMLKYFESERMIRLERNKITLLDDMKLSQLIKKV